MPEVIICEKPSSAEKIAKALSPSAKKKVYNKKVKYNLKILENIILIKIILKRGLIIWLIF